MITLYKLGSINEQNPHNSVIPTQEAIARFKNSIRLGQSIVGDRYVDVEYIPESIEEVKILTEFYRARGLDNA